MALQFERDEYEGRLAAARAAMGEQGLAAMLLFAPESHYYLTGFDTEGFVFFQCLVFTADGRLLLLTRLPDLEQARQTSIVEDVRIWYDAEGANPAEDLRALLEELDLRGQRLGIELNTYGLTGWNWERVRTALDGWDLMDASGLVRSLRLVKSEAEVAYVRRAAELADDALEAMLSTARPGVSEGEVNAAGVSAILRGGGELSAAAPILGSGERALLVRAAAGPRVLSERDQLTMEFAGSFRHYHACLMRTVAIGEADPRQQRMFDVASEALQAMTDAVRPGHPLGGVDEAHRRVMDAAGFREQRLASCGYSLGATFRPNWMDSPPHLYVGNPILAQPGMVLFLHSILIDAPNTLAMSIGHTVVVDDRGAEVLSRLRPAFA
jgi:Xaa-Pro dipeptidase